MQPILELFVSGNTSGTTSTSTYGGQLDMYDSEQINLTYEVKNINDFTTVASSHSQSFVLPGTKNNNALFGFIFEIGSDSTFNPQKKAPAYLLCDSETVMEGYLQLNGISTTNLGEIMYNVVLYTDTGDLFSKIEGKYLTDLDFSELTHELSEPNIVGSWFNPFVNNYYYGLVDYGSDWHYSLQNGNNGVFISMSDMYPALYHKYVWDKIFSTAGKTYTSNILVTSAFTQAVMPFNGNKNQLNDPLFATGRTFWARFSANTATVGSNFTTPSSNMLQGFVAFQNCDTTTAPYFDNGSLITNSSGVYTSNAPTVQQFSSTVYCEIEPAFTTWTNFRIKCEFFRSNFVQSFYSSTKTYTTNPGPITEVFTAPPLNDLIFGLDQVPVQTNEVIQCRITYEFDTPTVAWLIRLNNFGNPLVHTYAQNTHWHNVVGLDWLSGQTVDFAKFVPQKIKQTDYVKSITNMFNLWIEPEKSNVNNLIIDSRQNYFSSGVTHNWTSKLDENKPVTQDILAEQKAKKYTFTYKQDSDSYNQLYESTTNQIFGQRIYDFENDFLVDNNEVGCIFSPSPIGEIYKSNNQILLPGIFKTDSTNNHQRTDSNIRFLARKNTQITDGRKFGFYGASAYTYYPYVGHLDNFFTGSTDYNWGPIEYEFFNPIVNIGYTTNNLYNLYWKSYVEAIGSKNSRFVTAYFYLTPSDVATFRFCDQIFCDGLSDDGGHFFIVNKIEYSPTQIDSYKVELIKLETVETDPPGLFPLGGTGGPSNPNMIAIGGNNNPSEPGTIVGGGSNFMSSLGFVQGEMNILDGGSNGSMILGDYNKIGGGSPGNIIIGFGNSGGTQTQNSQIFGEDTITQNGFGSGETLSNNNFVKGVSNSIIGSSNIVYGSSNDIRNSSNNNLFNSSNNVIPGSLNGITAFNVTGTTFSASNTVYLNNVTILSGITLPPGFAGFTGFTAATINTFPLGIQTPTITGDSSLNLVLNVNPLVTPTNFSGTTSYSTVISSDAINIVNSLGGISIGSAGGYITNASTGAGLYSTNFSFINNSVYSIIAGGIQGNSMRSVNSSVILGGIGLNLDNTTGNYLGGMSNFSAMIVGSANTISNSRQTLILGGSNNTISGSSDSTILVGQSNYISGSSHSALIGGQTNKIIDNKSSAIVGGSGHTIDGHSTFDSSFIGGGYAHTIANLITSSGIVGGSGHTLSFGSNIFVGGGLNNVVAGNNVFVGGGETNTLFAATYSSMIGGLNNNVSNDYTTIIGGELNTVGQDYSSIIGGRLNSIFGSGVNSAIIAGSGHTHIDSENGFIGGGTFNRMSGTTLNSAIVGGWLNTISASTDSFIGGGALNSIGGDHNGILGGVNQHIENGDQCALVGGDFNFITDATNSATVGGNSNSVSGSTNSGIVFGSSNNITRATGSTIVGGNSNTIISYTASSLDNSVIVGGQNNLISENSNIAPAFTPFNAFILGGQDNIIDGFGRLGGIVGGTNNTLHGTFGSVIVGGTQNMVSLFGGPGTVIVGGTGITGSTTNMVYVPNLNIQKGKTIFFNSGTNSCGDFATLTLGTVVVSNTGVTANSMIQLTAQDNNSVGALRVSARVANTSFTITSSNLTDNGVVAWAIFERI